MNSALDPVRRLLGLIPTESSIQEDDHGWVAGAPPGYPAEALGHGMRRFLTATAVVSSIVALTHQALTGALVAAHHVGVFGAARAALTWPWPLAQPILAGVGAFALIATGVQAGGWRRVTRRQRWYVLGFTVAAVLGAAPMVLICALSFVVGALIIGIALAIFLGMLALLLAAR